ncbi:rhodanese-like domain-containing protein [Gemella cuniculi]|uniref:rhodanese-like domain-containing protein n=1 Tax=Gemella cuniculi TaxID=150240 RepID=UPI00041FF22D|nr:rhodanese-like domain-containing protein [Gemella cuniculi]
MKQSKLLAVSMAAVLSLTLAGCSSSSKPATDNNGNTVAKAMSGEDLNKIEKDDKEKEKYLVIDVRDAKEYKEGHVKHAINISVGDIDKNIEKINSWKEKPVVVYCNTGKKSKEAADKLIKAGFKDVSDAKGVKEYKDYELVKYTTLLAGEFQEAITKKEGVFFDAREKKDFDASHVEGAHNVDAKNLDNLASLLPEDKSTPIYSYCYSGNRSSKVAQKAVELGYTNVYNAMDGTKEHEYKF